MSKTKLPRITIMGEEFNDYWGRCISAAMVLGTLAPGTKHEPQRTIMYQKLDLLTQIIHNLNMVSTRRMKALLESKT